MYVIGCLVFFVRIDQFSLPVFISVTLLTPFILFSLAVPFTPNHPLWPEFGGLNQLGTLRRYVEFSCSYHKPPSWFE